MGLAISVVVCSWGRPGLKADPIDAQPVSQDTEVFSKADAAMVRILRSDRTYVGGGIVFSIQEQSFFVLTAAHVIDGYADADSRRLLEIPIELPSGKRLSRRYLDYKVVAKDSASDIAVLEVRSGVPPAGSLPIAEVEERPEEPRKAMTADWSDPKNKKMVATSVKPIVVSRKGASRKVGYWKKPGASAPGVSGSPLISAEGAVIGIASGNSGDDAYYSDLLEIQQLLRKLHGDGSRPQEIRK